MKQFSVKEYLANPSRNVVTRDGRPVRIVCTDAMSGYPIIALIRQNDNTERMCKFTQDGTYVKGGKNNVDLFFVPEKNIAWANLYCTELGTMFTGEFFKTEEAALKEKVKDLGKYITTFKVQWEE